MLYFYFERKEKKINVFMYIILYKQNSAVEVIVYDIKNWWNKREKSKSLSKKVIVKKWHLVSVKKNK